MVVTFAMHRRRGRRLSPAVVLSLLVQGCLEDSGVADPSDGGYCPDPMVDCGPACSDLRTDPTNCGACGNACAPGDYCAAGECVDECTGGLSACDRSCRDLTRESAHCGGCDRPCADGFSCVEGACVGDPPSDLRVRVSGAEFSVCGRPIFMNGVNTPWNEWDDFGGDYDATWWSAHYADLHDAGVNSSRVWITCSGAVGIDISSDGVVLGATPAHWEHLDSFFAIAEERQIYVMATLMSFDHFEDRAESSWKAWIASDANIDSYVENYLIPFLERYAPSPYLWSIDLINEPDWAVEREGVSFDRLRAYFARAARAIHENSDVLVTVGLASPKYNARCPGCEQAISDEQLREAVNDPAVFLDFYSPHYYDWIGEVWGNTLHIRPDGANFPIDKPLLIGEHPARGTSGHTLTEDLEAAFSNGWQGTMPWTSNGVDGNGGFAQVSVAATSFRDAHPSLVFPSCP
jgi:hypothetical protein